MQENETIISGVMSPKKRKRMPKIIGLILFFLAVGAGAYFIFSGRASGWMGQVLTIAVQSWHEVLGVATDGPATVEVSLDSRPDFVNIPSSTANFGENSSSLFGGDGFDGIAIERSSKKKKIISHSAVNITDDSNVADDANILGFSDNNAMQSSSGGLDQITITDPIAILDAGLTMASSVPGSVDSSTAVSLKKPPQCSFLGATTTATENNVASRVILNEVAWMGSPSDTGETATQAASHEWIELKNITAAPINLAGWQVADAAGNVDAVLGAGDEIGSHGFYLLSRDGHPVQGAATNTPYLGGLSNTGEVLAVFDAGCGISDILDASGGWPGGNNLTKQTLERKFDGIGWQTSLLPGGTPDAENSLGAPQAGPVDSASSIYSVEVTVVGDGSGKVTGKPTGISCATSDGSVCTSLYKGGTMLTLTAIPGNNATFAGWTGPCSGAGSCSFVVDGLISVMAQFRAMPSLVPLAEGDTEANGEDATTLAYEAGSSSSLVSLSSSTSPQNDFSPSSTTQLSHIVIVAVQIAGASSSNDFVKLFNPAASAIDLSGWKLHKKSSTGVDYSLRDFPKGTIIAPGTYFTWANSLNGFAASINADASSTETLSADNSIAIMDPNGVIVDAVAWGTGVGQYGMGPPYPIDPGPNQVLARKSSNGLFVDAGDNAEDFTTP